MKKEDDAAEISMELRRTTEMRRSVAHCLLFCYLDSNRDGVSGSENFFLRMIDDILQSVVAIEFLAREGMVNTCRRELRYLTELSIKSLVIVNGDSRNSFESQVSAYENLLDSPNINPINSLNFSLLGTTHQEDFKSQVKRIYGYLSKYTHSGAYQIRERLLRAEQGRSVGYEGFIEIQRLNDDIERVLAIVLVMVFHAVGEYVVGDYLVEEDGGTANWYFTRSKFISIIDEYFDYKFERQWRLDKLKAERLERIRF